MHAQPLGDAHRLPPGEPHCRGVAASSDLLTRVMHAAANDAIIVTDHAGVITAFSRGAETLLGYGADEVIGLLDPSIFHVPADVDAMVRSVGQEWIFARRDGSRFVGSLAVDAHHDGVGGPCGFVAVVRDITAPRRDQTEVDQRSDYDQLTGLANRAHLEVALSESADDETWVSPGRIVLFIDLDHFQRVNDTLGHAAGDAVLAGVADRLKENLRVADLPARIGGDEFVVLLGPNMTAPAAADIAERIVEALATPFAILGTKVTIGASVGLATSSVHHTPGALMAAADNAAYAAKHAGRGRVVAAVR